MPYRIHTLLTDNGIQFAEQPRNKNTAISRMNRFDMICEAIEIEHRLTDPELFHGEPCHLIAGLNKVM